MATGDAAAAAGLTTYGNDLLVSDVDTALNQRGDDTAAVIGRVKTLETQSISVPKFSVKRSTNGQSMPENTWTQMTAAAWATPVKSVGGFTWTGGVLTVPRAGIYSINAVAHFYNDDYFAAGIQVTRNSATADSGIVCKAEWWMSPVAGSRINPSVQTTDLAYALNAGDLLRVFVLNRNNNANPRNTGSGATDLALQVVWTDSL
jgi:hypothetical protein